MRLVYITLARKILCYGSFSAKVLLGTNAYNSQINNILKKYKLEIKDVGGIEKVAFADKQSFMDENVTDSLPTLNKNDMFVQGCVYFEIGPI